MSATCSSAAAAATQCVSAYWETHADARSAAQPCAVWDKAEKRVTREDTCQ